MMRPSNFSFSTCLENFVPFSSILKLSSANSETLEESDFCHLGKGKKNNFPQLGLNPGSLGPKKDKCSIISLQKLAAPPWWLSGERFGLMTWWL